MDDAAFVGVLDGVDELVEDGQGFVPGDGAGAGGEGGTFDEFEDEGGGFEAVDGGDAGVVEGRKDLGFAGEAREALGILGEFGG